MNSTFREKDRVFQPKLNLSAGHIRKIINESTIFPPFCIIETVEIMLSKSR